MPAESAVPARPEPAGPRSGGGLWAPRYACPSSHDVRLEGQVAAIERAAREAGEPLPERELLARANARHWGPSVPRRALRRAVAEGRIRRRGGGYAPAAQA
jgi:hypothetical protein